MAPTLNIPNQEDFERTKKYLELHDVNYNIPNIEKSMRDFIYVPLINLDVSKKRTLFDTKFYDTQKIIHPEDQKMLTIPEFKEFLRYTKENYPDIYREITEVRSDWRSEWIDADFKMKGKEMYVNYHVFDENGKIIKKSKKLDKETLMKNKTPGISLDSWLEDSSKQGLPQKSIESGSLYYLAPMKDNNSVAGFVADDDWANFNACRSPSYRNPHLGVRVAKWHK